MKEAWPSPGVEVRLECKTQAHGGGSEERERQLVRLRLLELVVPLLLKPGGGPGSAFTCWLSSWAPSIGSSCSGCAVGAEEWV